MRNLIILILFALSYALAVNPPDAIGSLYSRDESGSLRMTCTASVVDGAYLELEGPAILTASHCVEDSLELDDVTETWRTNGEYLITFDERTFYGVRLVRVGYTQKGYDLAVLTFSDDAPEVTPMTFGDWAEVEVGSAIIAWSNPLGIGLQYFTGAITMLELERPIGTVQDNWRGYSVAVIPSAGGSSGSLILNTESEIIGVLIGVVAPSAGSSFTVLVPLSRFAVFLSNDAAGRPISY